MSKVLVIPDVHLKPEMFDYAEAVLKAGRADYAVQLGDLVDDWDQGYNLPLYDKTFERAIKFAEDFPKTIWCWGNHDVAYIYNKTPSGHSVMARENAKLGFSKLFDFSTPERVPRVLYRDGNCLFSHAGLTLDFLPEAIETRPISDILLWVNYSEAINLWEDNSPLWFRALQEAPEYIVPDMYTLNQFYHITGHTPVKTPCFDEIRRIAFFDTWSTRPDHSPYGDKSLCVVDTECPSAETTEIILYDMLKEMAK